MKAGGAAGQIGNRGGDEIGANGEIALELNAAKSPGGTPGKAARNTVTSLIHQCSFGIGIAPATVETG